MKEIGAEWAPLPLLSQHTRNARVFHVSFRTQCENSFWWWIGESNIFGLGIQNFMDIDTFVCGSHCEGTTFTNPYNANAMHVPTEVVENMENTTTRYLMGTLCLSGALSGRVRVVRLLVDGKLKHECVVDQTGPVGGDKERLGTLWVGY
ncbi:hypothetical protein BT96DRAFT_951191 [Gymnopus androsaceus JB14]|uniref:Uncharacterized protein n=1 Tax=Gymnopus androsaceus JB14 TaxID=1447944 RepID=A0A6A4GDH2_9AGAR|nr:hypothetical protein BT96DRAFT_951191 [Gymnopus androsaceus JB14]